MKGLQLLAALLLALAALLGCNGPEAGGQRRPGAGGALVYQDDFVGMVVRFHDDEAKATCWVGHGISCIRDQAAICGEVHETLDSLGVHRVPRAEEAK